MGTVFQSGLRSCIFNKLAGAAGAADPWTPLCVARASLWWDDRELAAARFVSSEAAHIPGFGDLLRKLIE